ncbi:hypothetical protein CERZMDRAFT_89097 [Cercospora zeae-maydis SCOH1-5]|uniref:DUF7905 domain-containing protein n=1 Tax=Cercospora zeae-maydis SCOH1-5 TaxID=717836 RepID=A0A6A6EZX3_9PEZI|nr:hypothetical protein CERZMDRAFT_89097 [Cercospora zeae-maydis SCOH1-5]
MDYEFKNSRSWQQAGPADSPRHTHAQQQADEPAPYHRSGESDVYGRLPVGGGQDYIALGKGSAASVSSHPRHPASKTKENFAKLASLTPELRRRHEKRWARAVQSNRFRQHPPADLAFGAVGKFAWPDDYKPQDVFGSQMEALDPIRIQTECYVVFQDNCFQVLGDNVQNVSDALLRIRRSYFQLTAQSMNGVRRYFSHWRSDVVPSHICLEPYQGPRSEQSRNDDEYTSTIRGEGETGARSAALANSSLSVENAKILIANALRKIHYFRGQLTLGIRLGTFLLEQYKPPEADLYELKEYEEMANQPQFAARVTEELGNAAAGVDVLSAIQGADHLLSPHDAMLDRLQDVVPSYAATFTFPDEQGDLCLVKSWQKADSGTESETVVIRMVANPDHWYRCTPDDTSGSTHLLQVALTDVNTGTAWQFDLTAKRSVDPSKLPNKYTHFAASITSDAATEEPDQIFARRKSMLTKIRQEVRYRYNLSHSDYTLDLARFQDYTFSANAKEMDAAEPAWALRISRPEWAENLSRNKDLAVGTSADWSDNIDDAWFPADFDGQDGFAQLVDKLAAIEKVLQAEQAVDQKPNTMHGLM